MGIQRLILIDLSKGDLKACPMISDLIVATLVKYFSVNAGEYHYSFAMNKFV